MAAVPHETHGSMPHGRPTPFFVVAAVAFAVQFFVVVLLVPVGFAPLAANAAGFGAAFVVGLVGHYAWTLRTRAPRRGAVLRRFTLVAVGGFALNEINYAALLSDTELDYRVGLLLVLAAVAALTRAVARDWVFAEV